jgi:hypothetical protein
MEVVNLKLPRVLPDSFLKALPESERKKMGKSGMTYAEAVATYNRGEEKVLKGHVLNLLNLRGAWLFDQPMSKKTRGRPGVPDIIGSYRGYFIAIELKAAGEQMTREQAEEAVRIRNANGRFALAYSVNDVIEFLDGIDADDQ